MDDDVIQIRTSLLIDADNVNVEVLVQVLDLLADGTRRLQHRRAYGSLQKAQEFEALCNEHAIRFTPTTYVGTNGTDVALTIDAIELAHAEPTDEFVLVTSDCDFLPLAARLRELGFQVRGYGQQGKSAPVEGYLRVYDEFTLIAGQAPKARQVGRAARETGRATAPSRRREPAAASSRAAAPTPTLATAPAAATAAAPASAAAKRQPPQDDEVRRILEAVPSLLDGSKVELGTTATMLRAAQLLAKNAPSTKLFKKYPEQFELTPARQPNKVQYRPR